MGAGPLMRSAPLTGLVMLQALTTARPATAHPRSMTIDRFIGAHSISSTIGDRRTLTSLNNGDPFLSRDRAAVIIRPRESESAAFLNLRRKLQIRIGSDRRIEIAAEHRLIVKLTHEAVDDLARDHGAVLVPAQAVFHRVRQQGLDLAALPFARLPG